jgi:hypothetical protein
MGCSLSLLTPDWDPVSPPSVAGLFLLHACVQSSALCRHLSLDSLISTRDELNSVHSEEGRQAANLGSLCTSGVTLGGSLPLSLAHFPSVKWSS